MTTPSEPRKPIWSLRRIAEATLGFSGMVIGLGWGTANFLTPRNRINAVYSTHNGPNWYQNTLLAVGFFIGLLGLAILLDALFGEPDRVRFRNP